VSSYEPGTFFSESLGDSDPQVAEILDAEWRRQNNGLELIASENHVSRATLDALASPIINKTVEGYPGRRYYGGAEHADAIERLALARAKSLFGAEYANVQPHSGSQANLAVFLAWLKPGDTVLSMDLAAGGHLSHGSRANISGKWMSAVHYGVGEDGLIDYDAAAALAREHRPKLIVAGGSAYPRVIDFEAMATIAADVGARFLADIAHIAGLVVAGEHPSPVPVADAVTTTTYKNLRGARGGVILSRDGDLATSLDSAVFPGVQGSVILNAVAAKAVCFGEAARPEFAVYARQVLINARALADELMVRGVTVVTGGTDTPIVLVDLRAYEFTGRDAQDRLESVGLTVNKNSVPGDERSPQLTSGIRLGTSAATARGLGVADFRAVARCIADVLAAMNQTGPAGGGIGNKNAPLEQVSQQVRSEVTALAARHPMDGISKGP